jgi:hypothetical protein
MGIPTISKDEAIASFGGNAAALARALGITPSAVYQWQDGPIAEGYALKLRFVLKREYFEADPVHRSPAAEAGDAAKATPVSTLSEAA